MALQLEAVPGLARLAATAWVRGAAWGVGTSMRVTRRLGEAAVSPESASHLVDDLREETATNLRRLLGISPLDNEGGRATGTVEAIRPKRFAGPSEASLRERGRALLDRAAAVEDGGHGPIHPGFDRIVDQLAPDEARLLKLLANEGPQAIVYINKAAPMGIGAREVARRLSLAGREAGCLRPELLSAYLDNLVRLGLVAIRRDPIESEQAYLVLEAQPEVVEAMEAAHGRVFSGQSSRRSIHITDFGMAFCKVCFPPEHLSGEFAAISTEEAEIAEQAGPQVGADADDPEPSDD